MSKNIIGIFSSIRVKTGAHKRYFNLLNELSKRGYTVLLYVPNGFVKDVRFEITYYNLKDNKIPITIQLYTQMKKITPRELVNNTVLVFGETNILAGSILKKKYNARYIYSMRSNFLALNNYNLIGKTYFKRLKTKIRALVYYFFMKRMYKHPDCIVVQNKVDFKIVLEKLKIDKSRIVIIPNNIEKPILNQHFPKKRYETNSINNYLFIGELTEYKGILLLMKTFNKYIKYNKNAKLTVLGEGPLKKECISYINKENLKNNITILGYKENVSDYILISDLLIVPSSYDSFPNVILEALNLEVPVIGSNIGGIKEMLPKELLFENTTEELLGKIHEISKIENYKFLINDLKIIKEKHIFDWVKEFEKIV